MSVVANTRFQLSSRDVSSVVVTGAAGFLGSAVVAQALAEGMTVHAVVRRPAPIPSSPRLHVHAIDLLDNSAAAQLRQIEADAYIHLAALLPQVSTDRAGAALASTAMALPVIDAAATCGVRIVLAGSSSEYGAVSGAASEDMTCRPATAYGAAKLAVTQLALGMGAAGLLDPVVLRPFVIYGPAQPAGMFVPDLLRSCAQGRHFAMTAGEQRRDFVYVEDAARAFVTAARVSEPAARLINIASGTSTRVIDVAHRVADAFGRRDLLGVGELPYPDGDPRDFKGDVAWAQSVLKWHAQVLLDDGIDRVVAPAQPGNRHQQFLHV